MSESRRRPPSRVRRILVLAAAVVTALGAFLAVSSRASVNTASGPDCTLTVPANPLTALGLATPYRLASAGQACSESDPSLSAFVQATILDPATGQVSVYNPLVITQGGVPGASPVVPLLPAGAVVAIWTGFNGDILQLVGPGSTHFVQFSQQSYLHSSAFFAALRTAGVTPPPLGMANDGHACPSTRDFSVVDQDQSDNVPVTELLNAAGQAMQNTTANAVLSASSIANGSDEGTIGRIDAALGCTPWMASNLADPGHMIRDAMLQEAQAAAYQQAPVALVPSGDPFVTFDGTFSLYLQNLYRRQVDQVLQTVSGAAGGADTAQYCQNLASAGEPRLKLDAAAEAGFPPPNTALGNNLANALANRFVQSWQLLGCQGSSPISVTLDASGAAISTTYGGSGTPTPTPTPTTPTPTPTTPTPTVTGGASVVYDSTGPATFGSQTPHISWTHNVGSGSNRALLVSASLGNDADDGCVMTATDNGVAMTPLAKADAGNKGNGFGQVYGLANPPVGANSISVTVANCTFAQELQASNGFVIEDLTGGSMSFSGVSQSAPFGTPVTAIGGTSGTASVGAGSSAGDIVAGFDYAGSSINGLSSAGTSRYVANGDSNTAAGNSAGATVASTGSGVSLSWSQVPDLWAVIAVQVQHA